MDISLYTIYHERRPRFTRRTLAAPERHGRGLTELPRLMLRTHADGAPLRARTGMSGMPSLMACLAAAGLEAEHENFFVHWDSVSRDDVGRLALRLVAARADIVGVGSMALFLPLLLPALEVLHRRRPGARVVLGGYGPSETADALLRHFPSVEAVVRGEGEVTLPRVVAAMRSGASLRAIPGVSGRDSDGVFHNVAAPRISDLGALPFPDHAATRADQFQVMAVQLSRGCPYSCTFCSVSGIWEPRCVERPVARAVAEVEALAHRFGIHHFVFADDTFNLHRRRVDALCDGLRELRVEGLWWHAFMRPDRVDDALCSVMAGSGCGEVLYGVESGSDRVLAAHKGGFSVGQAVEAGWLSTRWFETVMMAFCYGYPDETWDDFLGTVRVILHLLENDVLSRFKIVLNPVFPFPSTPVARAGPLTVAAHPGQLMRRYRAGHALARPLLRKAPELCSFSVFAPSPALAQKHVLAVDLWEVLEGDLTLDDYVRRHERALRSSTPPALPARGAVTRFLRRIMR